MRWYWSLVRLDLWVSLEHEVKHCCYYQEENEGNGHIALVALPLLSHGLRELLLGLINLFLGLGHMVVYLDQGVLLDLDFSSEVIGQSPDVFHLLVELLHLIVFILHDVLPVLEFAFESEIVTVV